MKAVPRVTLICAHCGEPFQRRQAELDRPRPGQGKYCSMACRGLGMRQQTTLKCLHCGQSFERQSAEVRRRRSGKAWCSLACQKAYWAEHGTTYPKIGARHVHRLVAERKLGRPIRRHEVVHHLNENKRDFREENLEVKPRREHSRDHMRDFLTRRGRDSRGRFL